MTKAAGHLLAISLCLLSTAAIGASPAQISQVTEQEAGSITRLPASGLVKIRLTSNMGTGYGWQLQPAPGVEQTGHAILKAERSNPGAPESEEFTLKVTKPGKHTITFTYRRPWEPTSRNQRSLSFTLIK